MKHVGFRRLGRPRRLRRPRPPERGQTTRLAALAPYLYGAGAILCWATLAAAIGESLRAVPPETVLFDGLLAAAVFLGLWQAISRRSLRIPWPGARIALLGVYGIWGYHTLLVMALHMAPKIEANILNYAWPLWIVLLGALLPGHRLTWRLALAGLMGFAGVALVIGGGLPQVVGGHAMQEQILQQQALQDQALPGLAVTGLAVTGLAIAVLAGLIWASFSVMLRRFVPPGEQHMPLFCMLAVAPAGLVALGRGAPLFAAPEHLPLLLYFGLVPLGLSFVLWERAVQGCNVQVLGMLSFFTPVLSTLLLALVSGATVGGSALAGLAIILGATLLTMRGRGGGAESSG